MKRIDYSKIYGKQYGLIKVIEKDEIKSNQLNKTYLYCKCECGKEKSFYANDIIHNKIQSCGCNKIKQFKNIKNKTFGKLKALEYKYTINKKAYWLCECECGNYVVISGSNLNSGHTKSCGCLRYNENHNNLKKHFRNILSSKIKEILDKSNYECFITQSKENLEVHHLTSFNKLIEETFNKLNISIYSNFYDYSKQERSEIDDIFLKLHDDKSLIVLNHKIHSQFHKEYGYGNNTLEQFKDFINKYYSKINRSTTSAI